MICEGCGQDLGLWSDFIHLKRDGSYCGEGTEEVVASYVWRAFGLNLDPENIDRVAASLTDQLERTLYKLTPTHSVRKMDETP